MLAIKKIEGREILDSRGYPALEVDMFLADDLKKEGRIRVSVPSGASTGKHEAYELRDGDPKRFFGKGLLQALSNLNKLEKELVAKKFSSAFEFDQYLVQTVDRSKRKTKYGANTILALSLAFAKALAVSKKEELFQSLNINQRASFCLPVPFVNVLNGGMHASNNLNVQEFMLVPYGFATYFSALQASSEIFYQLKCLSKQQGKNTHVGDEGGIAPSLKSNEEGIMYLLQAIEKAGYSSSKQVGLAIDVAASSFYIEKEEAYLWENEKLKSQDLVSIYKLWCHQYPILSIEDGLAEDDWEGWKNLTKELGPYVQLLGDDLFVTQCDRIEKGIKLEVANALLAKPNQVGTLTETLKAIELSFRHDYGVCISHRSGETEDHWLADLALAFGIKQIKAGSVCRGERVCKYNRLLRIESYLNSKASSHLYPTYFGKKAFPFL